MKKRILSILLSLLMAASAIPVSAVEFDAPEQGIEAASVTPDAPLSAIAESDKALYQPADRYGNLVGFISFDNADAKRDNLSWAPAIPEFYSNSLSTYTYVTDPLGEHPGLVLKQDAAATLYRSTLALFDSAGTDGFELGKYVLTFDVYTSSDTARDDYFRVDLGSKSWSINDEVFNNRGKWHTVKMEFEVTEVGETATIVSGGTTYTGINLKDVMQVWYNKSVASTTYYDNMALYHFPQNTAAFIDHLGNRVLADVSAMTAFPGATDVIVNSDDATFAGWKDENGTLYTPGTAVTAADLQYHTFTGVAKAETYFAFGDKNGSITGITYIPFPSEVDESWSDDGFYAWYDDFDGSYYFPGEAADMELLDGAELAAIDVADFNATIDDVTVDVNKGVLVTGTDFEKYDLGFAKGYGINQFDTLPFNAAFAKGAELRYFALGAGVEVVNDPVSGGTHGKVLYNKPFYEASVQYMTLSATGLHAGAGTLTVEADAYSPSFTAYRIDFGGTVGPMASYSTNVWNTISRTIRYDAGVNGNVGGQVPYALNSIIADIYYDNINLWYKPDGAVFFKNTDGSYAVYYAGADGNITVPAPSAVNADWSDEGFKSWTSTNGTHYSVGSTVSAASLAGQILENVVVSATFVKGEASEVKGGLDAIPYPSEVNDAWSDAGFYAWTDGETYYFAGEGFTADLNGKTFTTVDIAGINAAAGDYTVDMTKGIFITGTDFEKYDLGFDKGYGMDQFDTLPYNAAFADGATLSYFALGAGVEVVNDPKGTHGKVLYNKPFYAASVQYMTIYASGFRAGAGTLTAEGDACSPGYNAFRIDIGSNAGGTVWVDADKWNTISRTIRYDNGVKGGIGGQVPYALINTISDIYYDNINLWYKPDGVVYFKNTDGKYAIYFAGADGNITIPAPSALNTNWVDTGFGGWTASDGTHYDVGDTVSAASLAGKYLENKVIAVNFNNGSATEPVNSLSAIPFPSEVNAAWSDAGFAAWTDGTSLYLAGDAASIDALNGKTLTIVNAASFNALMPEAKIDGRYGYLVGSTGFETVTGSITWNATAYDYINTGFIDTLTFFGVTAQSAVLDDPTGEGHGKVAREEGDAMGYRFMLGGTNPKIVRGDYTLKADVYATQPDVIFDFRDVNDYVQSHFVSLTVPTDTWSTQAVTVNCATFPNYNSSIWGNGTGTLYVDNLEWYYRPANAVVFEVNGESAMYFAGADGNIVMPAPSAVTTGWKDAGFLGWKAADGTVYAIGSSVSAADLDGAALVGVTCAPFMLNKASIRLNGASGLRFASYISNAVRNQSVEYGFIVALKSSFAGVDYDYDTNLVFPAGYDTADLKGTLALGGKFINGINYKPAAGIDLVYATDGSVFGSDVTYTDGVYFTGVLIGITGYDQYHSDFVARSYTKIGDTYFYGTPIVRNLYDMAAAWQAANGVGVNEYIDGIVSCTK